MIKNIRFTQTMHPFPAGTSIDFTPGVNLICGDQGTGKSTLLDTIMMHDREYANHVVLSQDYQYNAFAYYSSEFHNPRQFNSGVAVGETRYNVTLEMFFDKLMKKIKESRFANVQHFMQIVINAYQICMNSSMNVIDKKLVDLDIITKSAMQSHGQALFPFLEEALKVHHGIVFLDEPETSLSILSQRKLAKMLVDAGKNNQIFVATHSQILMEAMVKLIVLNNGTAKWEYANNFIKEQQTATLV